MIRSNIVIRSNTLVAGMMVALVGLWAGQAGHAQETAGEGASKPVTTSKPVTNGYKIGVVDIQQVLKGSTKRKKGYDELTTEKEAREDKLSERNESLRAMAEKFEADRASMTAEERFDMKNKIDIDIDNLQRDKDLAQREIFNLEEKILNNVIRDIKATIERLGKDQNYHVILSAKTDPNRGYPYFSVLYHHSSIDLTSEVIAMLNASSE